VQRVKHPQRLGDKFNEPDAHDASFVVLFEGWVDDLLRLHRSLAEHLSGDWELVCIDDPVDDDASQRIAGLERVVHVPLRDGVGWAAGRNLGLRLATGRTAVVIDTSVELEGDALARVDELLDDPTVGLAGAWGVRTSDAFHFEESSGEGGVHGVHGVEAYLMAARRSTWRDAGLFDPKFRFYRNADIDQSFRVRAAGLRTVVDPSLAVVRHEHRLWASTPEAERDELSRKNFFRFRDHWAERTDLFEGLSASEPG
jgi:GT2 family glycosyltransferase